MLKRVILSEAPFFTKYSLPYNYQIVNRVFGNFDTPVSDGGLVCLAERREKFTDFILIFFYR